jgi:hypothetical protein
MLCQGCLMFSITLQFRFDNFGFYVIQNFTYPVKLLILENETLLFIFYYYRYLLCHKTIWRKGSDCLMMVKQIKLKLF